MCERAAFIAAIRAEPDEDIRRLAFADWLDDRDSPALAGVIRDHIAAHRLRPFVSDVCGRTQFVGDPADEWTRLMIAVTAITSDPERNGLTDLLAGCADRNELFWSRGFVERLSVPAGDWLAHGAAVIATHPIRQVSVTTWPAIREVSAWFVSKFGRSEALGFHEHARQMFADLYPGIVFYFPKL